ncbi:hypothetical protein D3C77_685240 [compost metagenome]
MDVIGVEGLERGVSPFILLDAHGRSLPPDRAGGKASPPGGDAGDQARLALGPLANGLPPALKSGLRLKPALGLNGFLSPLSLKPGFLAKPPSPGAASGRGA